MEYPETFCLTLPARYRYLKLIGDSIDLLLAERGEQGLDAQIIYGIKLAVHEIANNIIEHAYGHEQGEIKVVLYIAQQPDCFVAHLYDTGTAFDPTAAPTPPLDDPQESGYGLFLARQLLDEVNYAHQPEGNHWHLTKKL
jgi:serine/threonine-protein kinase RsbW